jgi:hypothetical protein
MVIKKSIILTDKEICDKWIVNKNINPITSRKIKETGNIYKNLLKKCLNNKKEEYNNYDNIIDRINYYLIIKKSIMSIKEKNNTFRIYNIDENTKERKFIIANKIILDKKVDDSIIDIRYLSYVKTDINNKFIIKIVNNNIANINDITILKFLTTKVIESYCPHFPICYGSLECNNDYSIIKDNDKDKIILLQINEINNGDLYDYFKNVKNKHILNTISQLLLSIMFFHYYTKSSHLLCYSSNFQYHKIKKGGYFHYNIYGKDYYLKNNGYLWIITDFTNVRNYDKEHIRVDYDFITLLQDIRSDFKDYFKNSDFEIISELYDNLGKYFNSRKYKYFYDINNEILNYLIKYNKSFKTKKPSNIINKKPFIITTK